MLLAVALLLRPTLARPLLFASLPLVFLTPLALFLIAATMLFRFPVHAVGVCSPLAFLLFFPPAALLFFHLPARLCIAHKTLPLEARPQLLLFASVTLFQFFAQPVLLFLPAAFFFLLALALLLLAAAMLFLFLAPALFLRA
ncbi:MAG TPA: hypothetical protein VMK12_06745, partial [Anaeromyxobacteraceae bacterium]|nr:hypothetical protein [Anaeromyxobacteraceae bacterium]